MANTWTKLSIANPSSDTPPWAVVARDARTMAQRFANWLEGIASGTKTASSMRLSPNGVVATGTITLVSAANRACVRINGVDFIATTAASVPAANTWATGVSDTADAASLAAAINASTSAGIAGVVTATSALGVVTVTATEPGAIGNALTIEFVGARATGTITLNNTVSTKSAGAPVTAISAVGGATSTATVVTVVATAHGYSSSDVVVLAANGDTLGDTNTKFPSGSKTITVVDSNTFTYSQTGTNGAVNTLPMVFTRAGKVSRSGTTVTVVSTSHGFSAGNAVYCTSADPNYTSGWKVILTSADANTFTYKESGTTATNTAAITYTSNSAAAAVAVTTGLVLSSNVVTATTTAAHGYTTGQTLSLPVAPTGFATGLKVITVTDATHFTYAETHADIASNDIAVAFITAYVPTIGGTAVTGVPWVAPTDDVTATAIAAAINANTTVAPLVTAWSAAKVVTIASDLDDLAGNTITTSVTGKGSTQSAARLVSGALAGTAASATITIASGSGTITATINGVDIAITWATSDTNSAALLAAAINSSTNALVRGVVVATSAAGVVTVSAVRPGTRGNVITLAATGTGATASATALASGAAGTTVVPSAARLTLGSNDTAITASF